ncbi:MAG: class I SAM-dependent methyltransferase [Planctomycetes bacterium]|nr:class I SAM-dependent methyltransferase [Planctomycetota bacterium]
MSQADRDQWNTRYRERGQKTEQPSSFLLSLDDLLPFSGRTLDVAGGAGRQAIWLARRGLDVTLADVSEEAISLAEGAAASAGVRVTSLVVDLETEPFPAGPWDLIVSFYYLQRSLFEAFAGSLAPGGLLVFVQPTMSNLERHARPPARFLLEDGELPGLLGGLEIIRYEEGWQDVGRHEARLVARKG